MTRVKKGLNAAKTRRNVLRATKGYRHGRSTKERAAYEALVHAGAYAFAHRKDKKNDFRKLWHVRINAVLRENGTTWSKFANVLRKKNVKIDRKILSTLAEKHPETFKRVMAEVK